MKSEDPYLIVVSLRGISNYDLRLTVEYKELINKTDSHNNSNKN
jgi:hypothetical protein